MPASRRSDRLFARVLGGATAIILILVAALVLILLRASAPALRAFGPGFLVGRDWDPVRESFGALPFLVGTIASSAVGLLLAVPVGIGSAIFISEIAPPRARRALGLLIDLLAAVPSVIYGLWGIFVLAPWVRSSVEPFLAATLGRVPLLGSLFQGPQLGVSLLAAGMILGIIVLPYISAVSREALLQVPHSYREGALALGATRWEAIRLAVLPAARSGLVGAVFLGLGRALGETMAVTMVIGNRAELPTSLFDPAHTIASSVANEFAEAQGDLHLSALAELALILMVVTLVLNALARLLVSRLAPQGGRRAE
jgi:phosphate transport system permease protein